MRNIYKCLRKIFQALFAIIALYNSTNSDSLQKEPVDSLLEEAIACLSTAHYECARNRYVQAHHSGMSRDSLCYFIADLYFRKGNFDTAFVYNFACKSTDPELSMLCRVQRQHIIDTINSIRKMNVVAAIPGDTIKPGPKKAEKRDRKRAFNYINAFVSPAYLNYKSYRYFSLGDLLLPYYTELKKPYTSIGLSDKFIYDTKKKRLRTTQQFSFAGQYSLDQYTFSSTLQRFRFNHLHLIDLDFDGISVLFSSNIEDLKKGSRFTSSLTISSDLKGNTFYSTFSSINYPVKIEQSQYYLGFSSRFLLDKDPSIADSKIGINLTGSGGPKDIFQCGPMIDLSYNWRPEIKIFKMKIGYTDSLVSDKKFSYYYDKDCLKPSEFRTLVRKYWANLPSEPWIYMPQQNISSTIGFNGMTFWKNSWSLFGITSFTGQVYTHRTIWHTTRYIPDMIDEADYETFYLLYEKKGDQYYSKIHSESVSYVGKYKATLQPEEYNFRRIDASFFALLKFQYTGKIRNNFSITGWFGKTRSNISRKPIPTPIIDYKWGFQIEYNPTLFYF